MLLLLLGALSGCFVGNWNDQTPVESNLSCAQTHALDPGPAAPPAPVFQGDPPAVGDALLLALGDGTLLWVPTQADEEGVKQYVAETDEGADARVQAEQGRMVRFTYELGRSPHDDAAAMQEHLTRVVAAAGLPDGWFDIRSWMDENATHGKATAELDEAPIRTGDAWFSDEDRGFYAVTQPDGSYRLGVTPSPSLRGVSFLTFPEASGMAGRAVECHLLAEGNATAAETVDDFDGRKHAVWNHGPITYQVGVDYGGDCPRSVFDRWYVSVQVDARTGHAELGEPTYGCDD